VKVFSIGIGFRFDIQMRFCQCSTKWSTHPISVFFLFVMLEKMVCEITHEQPFGDTVAHGGGWYMATRLLTFFMTTDD
jgi:hypothetical protein